MKTNRRQFIKQIAIGGSALGTAGFPILSFSENNLTKLTILHTNDLHSRIEPFPLSNSRNGGKGGFVHLNSLISEIRKKEKNILLFDSGDIFQGTPYFNFYKGEIEFKLMSKIGYDAATIGNHDFDLGVANLSTQMVHANFPFISANYDFSKTILKNKIDPYKIFKKGKFKIGVFGLGIALRGLVDIKKYKGVKYNDPVAVANETASFLKENKGCNLVVCLSHLGYKYRNNRISDVLLAQKTKNIDIILGGHTHTFMKEADRVKNLIDKEVVINQVGWSGLMLGKIDISFQENSDKLAIKSKGLSTGDSFIL